MKLAIRRPLGESRSPSAVPLGVPLLEQDCDPPAEAILLDVAGQQLLLRHRVAGDLRQVAQHSQ